MAVSFPNGFKITCQEAVDNRLVLSKAEMLAMKKAKMPSVYFCMCKDDGNLYLYNDTNEIDAETGRFRLFSGDGDFDADVIS